MSNIYLQSLQKFQIWDIVSSKKEDEHVSIMIWALNLDLGLKSFPLWPFW